MGMWRTTMFAGALFVLLGGVAVADQPPPPGYWSFPGTALKNWCPQHLDDPKCQVTFVPARHPAPASTAAQNWCSQAFAVLGAPGIDPI
jgi:hypothetical protein